MFEQSNARIFHVEKRENCVIEEGIVVCKVCRVDSGKALVETRFVPPHSKISERSEAKRSVTCL